VKIESIPLASLAVVSSGGGAPQDPTAFSESGHPFVRAGSLPRLLDGVAEQELEKLQPETAGRHGLKLFPKGTVLFAKSGMSATKGYVYSLKGPAYVVSHLAALVPRDQRDSSYLVRALQMYPPFSEAFNPVYEECRRQQDLDVDNGRNSRDCAQEAKRVAMAVHPEPRWPVAFVALAPIPIAWLLVWGLVALVRWVRRGLQP
jgi:hypothetical protein